MGFFPGDLRHVDGIMATGLDEAKHADRSTRAGGRYAGRAALKAGRQGDKSRRKC